MRQPAGSTTCAAQGPISDTALSTTQTCKPPSRPIRSHRCDTVYRSPHVSPFFQQQSSSAGRWVRACTRSSAGTTRSFWRTSNCAAIVLGLLWVGSLRWTRPAVVGVSAAISRSRSNTCSLKRYRTAARHGCCDSSPLTAKRETTTAAASRCEHPVTRRAPLSSTVRNGRDCYSLASPARHRRRTVRVTGELRDEITVAVVGEGEGGGATKVAGTVGGARAGGMRRRNSSRAKNSSALGLAYLPPGDDQEDGEDTSKEAMGRTLGVDARYTTTTPMQTLRNSVMDFPRLTRDEEVALGEDVQRWQQLERVRGRVVVAAGGSEEMRLDAWAAAADISVEDLRRLVQRGAGARERLVLSHVRLVIHIARARGWSSTLSPMDLVQEGAIALHMAVARYDPSRGFRFFTYADWALTAAFEEAEATQAGAVRLPRYLHVELRRLRAVIARKTSENQYPPTREELAESLGISVQHLATLLLWSKGCDSMDRGLISEGTSGEIIPGPHSLEAILQRVDAEVVLAELLQKLRPQEAQVVLHRYGLLGRHNKSTLRVAAMLGVSPQYVGRLQQSALDKMRAALEEECTSTASGSSENNRQHAHSIVSTLVMTQPSRKRSSSVASSVWKRNRRSSSRLSSSSLPSSSPPLTPAT